ncbi:MAG: peptidase [Phycisphaerales bacterium]|nr:peptidase [Phycisphaerales bacterium]
MLGSFVTLILVLFALGLLSSLTAVFAMAMSLLRPPRMTDGKATWVLQRISPGDLGLGFEETHFIVRDERDGRRLRLAGWWIPAARRSDRCVILLHGYADAKVGAIAWAPVWHELGFNVLAIDLRAHGESDGAYCTAGFWERHDVSQVIDELRAVRPQESRQLVLFGVSMGAAVATATAAMRTDLSAVVLESPFADFRHAATAQMERLGAPGRPFQQLALKLAQHIAGCDFGAVRPVEMIREIACPLMIVAPDGDPMMTAEDQRAIEQTFHSRDHSEADVLWPVQTGHLLALHAERQEYERRLCTFLNAAIPSASLTIS